MEEESKISIDVTNSPLFQQFAHNQKFFAQCFYKGPTGSLKDKVAQAMVEKAKLQNWPNMSIIEKDNDMTRALAVVPFDINLSCSLAYIGHVENFAVLAFLTPEHKDTQREKMLRQLINVQIFYFDEKELREQADRTVQHFVNARLFDEYSEPSFIHRIYLSLMDEFFAINKENKNVDVIYCSPGSAPFAMSLKRRLGDTTEVIGCFIGDEKSKGKYAQLKPGKFYNPEIDYFFGFLSQIKYVEENEAQVALFRFRTGANLSVGKSGGGVVAVAKNEAEKLVARQKELDMNNGENSEVKVENKSHFLLFEDSFQSSSSTQLNLFLDPICRIDFAQNPVVLQNNYNPISTPTFTPS